MTASTRLLLSTAALALPLAACSVTETAFPAPLPLDVGGGFDVSIRDVDRLVVASSDGRVLLDGLPPAAIAGADDPPPLVGFAVRDVTTTYEMEFGSFKPTVDPHGPWRVAERLVPGDGGALDLADASGAVLAHLRLRTPEPGHLVADIDPGEGPERHLSWGFACDPDDHFAGFGAQSLDVDHRGFTVPTWVQEQGIGKIDTDTYSGVWFLEGTRHASQVPIPQVLSRRGYLLTAESDLRSIFALCSERETAARVEIEMPARIHVFDGPSPAQAIDRATTTFGRPRMPPRIAFAPWFDAIFGSANVRTVAQHLRAAGIPGSVIWTEDWRGGDWNGDEYTLEEEWEVNTTLYPDMPQLSSDLHAEGLDFFVYFNPFVYKTSKAWPETQPKGYLIKHPDGTDYTFTGAKLTDCSLIDLDNPDARTWAVGKMQAAIALGADGWMNDFGEWLPTDAMTFAGPSLPRHNPYPVAWQETARAAIDGIHDGEDRLFFARSGWFGSAPLVDVMWAGDQRTDFEADDGIPTILPIGIGLGVVGISTFGHDIAGYQSATNPYSTKELFFRWTELGAWSPVMRTHHGTAPLKEWSWSSDAETTAHFKRYTTLHMGLVPYLEGLAGVAANTGLPMWRGMMVAYPADARMWGVKDQVMLGDGILVAPVLTAGAVSRAVTLPAGRWYPWAGGAGVTGGGVIQAEAAVGEIPVYAAAGSVVPTYPDGVMTLVHGSAAVPDASSVGDDRVVYAFLGGSGSFTEAGGLGYTVEYDADATGELEVAWEGVTLGACAVPAVAPCVESNADGVVARVTGAGTLEVRSGGTLAARMMASRGAAGRAITWVIRR